jgi:hypothetical protein
MCIAAASFSASRFALAGHEYNAQTEYRFLEQHTPDLPLDCAVVMPDRFMANRVVSTEFPVWWLRGQHLIEANNLSSVSSPSCLTYYRGISCYRFTWQELQGAPAPSMRPECVDFERGFSLEPLKSQTFKSEPSYECFTTPVSELEIGFFNLVPADHSLEGWRL